MFCKVDSQSKSSNELRFDHKTTLTDLSSKRDFFIMNKLISTVEAAECFLQLILLIYSFKEQCFPSETGKLLSCKFTPHTQGSHFSHASLSVVSTLTWHGPCTSLARDSRMMKSQWNRTIFLRANEIAAFSRDSPRERETLKKHCNLWLRWKRNLTETLMRCSPRVIKHVYSHECYGFEITI